MQTADLQLFSQACQDLYAPGLELRSYITRSFRFLSTLVPCELVTCGILDRESRQLRLGFDREHNAFESIVPAFGQLMDRYPLFNFDPSTNEGRPFCRNQFFSPVKFRDLAIYSEVFRPLGIDNHCATYVPTTSDETLFFGIERETGPDFTSSELQLLNLAQSHLSNAWALSQETGVPENEVDVDLLFHAGLSRREADALFWMVEGKTNAEIAAILGLRLNTVKEYVSTIFDKTGTGNRYAAIIWAHRACRKLKKATEAIEGFVKTPAPAYQPTPI